MRITVLFVAVLVAIALPPSTGEALAILPVQDDRSLAVAYLSNPSANDSAAPSPAFSDFDDFIGGVGISNASQSSTIGTTGISGSGQTGVDGSGDGSGSSVFDVTFQVDELVGYVLSGDVFFEPGSSAEVTLFGPGGALYDPTLTPSDFNPLSSSGTLSPGSDYRLVVSSSHPDEMGFQGTQWTFGFDITSVPEPGTGMQFALGMLLAVVLHRSRPGS